MSASRDAITDHLFALGSLSPEDRRDKEKKITRAMTMAIQNHQMHLQLSSRNHKRMNLVIFLRLEEKNRLVIRPITIISRMMSYLRCLIIAGSHTGENLYMEYERMSTAFSLENKIVRLITDNASNNLSAFGELVIPGFETYFAPDEDTEDVDDDIDEANLIVSEGHCLDDENDVYDCERGEELVRLSCLVHTLQLVVKDGLKESACSRSSIAKVAQIAKLSHQSIPVAEKLQESKFSIPEAVITRWNSQFITVSKVLDIPHVFLDDLLADQKRNDLILSMKGSIILREFTSIFTLFAEATTRTQAEQS